MKYKSMMFFRYEQILLKVRLKIVKKACCHQSTQFCLVTSEEGIGLIAFKRTLFERWTS